MVFNSISFAVFLPVIFALYWSVPRERLRVRNGILLLGSYYFYACWNWQFLSLIIASSLVDYYVGNRLMQSKEEQDRKRWLWLSLGFNLALLGTFKYLGFFAESFESFLNLLGFKANWVTLKILLPVGISFYTFQTLSYTIDIYRRKINAESDWLNFFVFVAFFPQLVAGPIERASSMLPQFRKVQKFDYQQFLSGFRLILWGLIKKVVIADNLAYPVDHFYSNPEAYTQPEAWLAVLAFSIQIYGDFSGYSDIAIGTARLFGFKLVDNFLTPLQAGSLREFWTRWHISLMNWFRDYIYFPLGGSREGPSRHARNILLVFFISGLWHGSNWTFIFFGLMHGLGYLLESRILRKWKRYDGWPGWFYMYAVWVFSLILFRSENIRQAGQAFLTLWAPITDRVPEIGGMFPHPNIGWYTGASMVLMLIIDQFIRKEEINDLIHSKSSWGQWGIGLLMVLWLLMCGRFDIAPTFYYFQF
ncbi:MAG: MBOAT family O-acyltransferase [Bacteroidota bacterium]